MKKRIGVAETVIISLITIVMSGCYNLIKIKLDNSSKSKQLKSLNSIIQEFKHNKNMTPEQKDLYIKLLEAKDVE